ncbi:MAG TPA: hypothetical protein VKU00_00185 [Chthonomonadaceae bacterium]|nr:hypothetical protein [Chthonomonadaceae bacterium]
MIQPPSSPILILLWGVLLTMLGLGNALAQSLPRFDFTNADAVREWKPTHDIAAIVATPEGMRIEINGSDPYSFGPERNYPADTPLWLHIRLKSDQGGTGQIFYFRNGAGPTEENSARFPVRANKWDEVQVPLPALGPNFHLRFDPPGEHDACLVASISFESRILLPEPTFPAFEPPSRTHTIDTQSGELLLHHDRDHGGNFVLEVAGQPFAVGNGQTCIGYVLNGKVKYVTFSNRELIELPNRNDHAVQSKQTGMDEDGATWTLLQSITPAKTANAFAIETQVSVDRERSVVYLPLFLVHPGVGSFGENKEHSLLAGLEYLDKNEMSSSEADIIGPGSKRQTPDSAKLTFPLMVVQNNDRWLALSWEMAPNITALFDSPDRIYRSGGHVMGLLFPGSDGSNRIEGNLLPYKGETLAPNKPVILHVTLFGGRGKSVVPAMQQYVTMNGLPPVPNPGRTFEQYLALSAHGWLDSSIREGDRYRHAFVPGGSFMPQAIADGPYFMDWMAVHTQDDALRKQLTEAAKAALTLVKPSDRNYAGVSHVHYPSPALFYGDVEESVLNAREQARSLLTRFEKDGSIPFRKSPEGLDYGKTHFAPDANGLTAQVVASLLENAAYCGDQELIHQALDRLRALDKFADSTPRGAQTWEVPLHTPDILASAHLIKAYNLGYELTGDTHFLDMAKYWAWTGVPFVYLVNPTGQPVGLYATTPVYGATQWVSPNWMGLPVQWCGLVYSDALYRLHRNDPTGPWKQIADGITASGIQQTYGDTEPANLRGLLPDSFNLRPQTRNFAAINPGTVFANAIHYYNEPELYDYHCFVKSGITVHAPCSIVNPVEKERTLSFSIKPWDTAGAARIASHTHYILIVGVQGIPRVTINGTELPAAAYLTPLGVLILPLESAATIEITLP